MLGNSSPDFTLLIENPNPITGNLGWFMFILALAPGIWEELGFRGIMLSNLKEKYSDKTSILISGILFGLFHFANLTRQPLDLVIYVAIMAILLGISWGYLVSKSNTILPAILAHYLIDAVALFFVDSEITFVIAGLSSVAINFLLGSLLFRSYN